MSPLVEAGNRFAFDLYERLRGKDGNLFFSPASISVALAMTYAGAAGNTEAEMAKTLHLEMPKAQLNEQMRALLASWNAKEPKQGYRLDVANRLWGEQGAKFLDDFLRVTRDDYGAELAQVDFNQPEAARETINKWVEDKTQDKIKNLIPSPSSIKGARLVLTNAVYFKGDWKDQFNKSLTKDQPFHVTASQQIKAPLMHQKHKFRYAAVDDVQLLDMPYGDGSLSMVVLLPKKTDGLGKLEEKLSTASLDKWLGRGAHAGRDYLFPQVSHDGGISAGRRAQGHGHALRVRCLERRFLGHRRKKGLIDLGRAPQSVCRRQRRRDRGRRRHRRGRPADGHAQA